MLSLQGRAGCQDRDAITGSPRKAFQGDSESLQGENFTVKHRRTSQPRVTWATDGSHEAESGNSLEVTPYVGYVSLLCRLILGGVFAYAGAIKILDPGGLAASIRSYGLGLPEWFVSLSAHALPYLEVLLGLYLILGLFTKASAWATNVLMLVFIAALAQGALRGLEIDCGCFGSAAGSAGGSAASSASSSAASTSGGSGGIWSSLWLAFVRDLGLLGLGLWIVRAGAGKFAVDSRISQARSDQHPSTSTEATEKPHKTPSRER